jgi:predicted permease
MGMPLLLGRDFTPGDNQTAPKVAVVNQAWARLYFPAESPIGRRFGLGGPETSGDIRIVGVVRNARDYSLREQPPPIFYLPSFQAAPWREMAFEVRSAVNPAGMAGTIQREVAAVNRDVAVFGIKTQAAQRDESVARERSLATLATAFAVLAVVRASIGLYGVMSYTVSRRTREIGIRMALGAAPGNVVRLVLCEAMMLAAIGIAVGVPAALVAARLVSSLFFGLKPADPPTYLSTIALLAGIAALSGYLPSRRAARVDPLAALRQE